MAKIRFGVLGVSGHFIRRVAPPCRASEVLEFSAIASRDRARAVEVAGRLGIPLAFGDYESLVRSKDVDVVFIPLPNNLHLEWIKRAADAGKPVLCEKPLALDAAEAEEASAHAKNKGALLMEAFMYKFHPQWVHARELVRAGEIGEVHSIHIHFTYSNADPNNIRNIKAAGGGGLLDIGCYAVSAARFLLDREPGRVAARITYDPVFKTDTLASALLEFPAAAGAPAIAASFTVGTKTNPFQRVSVLGSAGSLEVLVPFNAPGDVPAEVVITTGVGTRVYRTPAVDQYLLLFEAFAEAARDGKPAPVDPADAVANLRVLDAIVRAGESGGWEKV
jgi:predicted dehydrogenase